MTPDGQPPYHVHAPGRPRGLGDAMQSSPPKCRLGTRGSRSRAAAIAMIACLQAGNCMAMCQVSDGSPPPPPDSLSVHVLRCLRIAVNNDFVLDLSEDGGRMILRQGIASDLERSKSMIQGYLVSGTRTVENKPDAVDPVGVTSGGDVLLFVPDSKMAGRVPSSFRKCRSSPCRSGVATLDRAGFACFQAASPWRCPRNHDVPPEAIGFQSI